MTVRLIGYWCNDQHPDYPHPHDLVDSDWDKWERRQVWYYLSHGSIARIYRGLSPCRFCDAHNGHLEFTDGIYQWPEGLAHYVREHDVRLPQEFTDHALSRHQGLAQSATSLDWWLRETT